MRTKYNSTFPIWAIVVVPAGMFGMISQFDLPTNLYGLLHPGIMIYGFLVALFLCWFCRTVVLSQRGIAVSRFFGLWKIFIPYGELLSVKVERHYKGHCLSIHWEQGLTRVWTLSCRHFEELCQFLETNHKQLKLDPSPYLAEAQRIKIDRE